MSEFASILIENLELLCKIPSKSAVKKQQFLDMNETLAPFLTSRKALNTKNKGQPTLSDVKQVLSMMLSNHDATDDFFEGLVQTRGAMSLPAIHYMVMKMLMTNPNQYAERVVGNTPDISEFKKNPTIPAMQRFLMRQCSSDETSTPRPYRCDEIRS